MQKYIESHGFDSQFYRKCKEIERKSLINLLNSRKSKAEYVVLKYAQTKFFSHQSKNKFIFPTFVDEKKLIRVRTRISLREDSHNFRYPIVLPENHNITFRIIEEKHKEMDHVGVYILISSLSGQFWIIRCRIRLRKILPRCIQSKIFSSKQLRY